jgi:hypothetical protein
MNQAGNSSSIIRVGEKSGVIAGNGNHLIGLSRRMGGCPAWCDNAAASSSDVAGISRGAETVQGCCCGREWIDPACAPPVLAAGISGNVLSYGQK